MTRLYCLLVVFIFSSSFCNDAYAQPETGEFIDVSIGFGVVAPLDDSDVVGSGFYAQAEYVWAPLSWLGVRPYAGVIFASGESDDNEVYRSYVKSNAFLLGAKARLVAPIPYFAPFLESGIGLSLGAFETDTPFTNVSKNGVQYHVPFSVGVALGKRHNIEVELTYYVHPSAEQFSGAGAIGVVFPIDE